jgi:uncharacterized SAM-binding protein YcdF (DUF218 family)
LVTQFSLVRSDKVNNVAKKKQTEFVYSKPKQSPEWLTGMGAGAFIGVWMGGLASLINTDLEWFWALGILLCCTALGAFRVSRMGLQITSGIITGCTALAMLTPVLQPMENYLDVTELPSQADVIVNLGAGFHCGANELEAASLARITKGLELWRSGYAKTMTVTDAHGLAPNCGSIEDAALDLIRTLYPSSAPEIVVLKDMKTTRTEAEAVAREAKIRGWRKILVVTSPTHSRRTKATFNQLKLDAFLVAATESRFDSSLHTPHDRLMSLRAISREIAGLVKYSLFGWF